MSQLKPGGLALIIKSKYYPCNIGKCVTTERLLLPNERIHSPIGEIHNWTSEPAWYCTGDVMIEYFSGRVCHGHVLIRPGDLIPLNGDPDAELLALPDYSRRVVLVPALSG